MPEYDQQAVIVKKVPEDVSHLIYAETDMSRFPVEPWATFTNLIFLFVILFWSMKTKLNGKKHPLITVSLPILCLGFICGTIFHATRSHFIWLFLDYMPILVLVLVGCIYLWGEIVKSSVLALILAVGPIVLYRLLVILIEPPHDYFVSIGYCVLALDILLPAICHCAWRHPKGWKTLCATGFAFAFAVFFRQIDMTLGKKLFSMGTHFLWHLFGGASVFFLIKYLYEDDLRKLARKEENQH